ncbi:MAG: PQQ-dependent dehydrogenase, methanol/ethanol family [Bryobacteraceae bacterium]
MSSGLQLLAVLLAAAAAARGQVTYERLRNSDAEPGNWLMYSGGYRSHRHSLLKQIDTANVANLRPVWVYQMDLSHKLETSPLVIDGAMYLTAPPSDVIALDTRTGRPYWAYKRGRPSDVITCCGQVNRGAAALGDLLYIGAVDGTAAALDARTGRNIWSVPVESYKAGYSLTGAPLVVKDKVIFGVAGGEFGIRGFLDAYRAATGGRVWRFFTVPGPEDPNSKTWKGDSWKTGGAPTWLTGSYDPDLNLIYWGTGNPAPAWNADAREGDNLYSNSMVAIDADTGKLRWHFQFTPHDEFDWDANQIPVLVDASFRGAPRKLLLTANRNGFYYVLDRQTGQFLHASPFAKQTWLEKFDDKGRPVRKPKMSPAAEGVTVYPSVEGATNWFSPAYNPAARLFYVAAREEGSIVVKAPVEFRAGALFGGGGWRPVPDEPRWGAIRALEYETGVMKWEFKLHSPPWGGLLSTAGGVIFGGAEEGDFLALDAASGKLLWRFQTGGRIIANPVTYSSGGKQQVAIASGQSIFAFGLE